MTLAAPTRLGAPTRLKRLRGFRPPRITRRERAGSPVGATPSTPAAPGQLVLMVDFTSPEGREWWAVGLGDTLAEALAFARDSSPTDTTWQPVRWDNLYGE